jgi:hypothetical protein
VVGFGVSGVETSGSAAAVHLFTVTLTGDAEGHHC